MLLQQTELLTNLCHAPEPSCSATLTALEWIYTLNSCILSAMALLMRLALFPRSLFELLASYKANGLNLQSAVRY